ATNAAARRRKRRRKKAQARCAPPRRKRSPYPSRRRLRKQACLKRIKPRRARAAELQPIPPSPLSPGPPGFRLSSPIAIYSGAFGARQAERLLWRAGFGPSPGHAEALAALGLHRAVAALTRPSGAPTLTGLPPTDG